MWGIIIPLLAGIAVGYLVKGKQDKSRLFWIGAIWAVVIAVVFSFIGWITGYNPLTASAGVDGFGLVVSFIVTLVVFLAGVWIGDVIEGRSHRTLPPSQPRV